MSAPPLAYRSIFFFWLPLAGTWLMMAAEGPYLAAVIARLPDPTPNLAAFGVSFAFAIIIESPVMMLMSASTALVEDGPSYRALRRFSVWLTGIVTAGQLVLLLPPVFDLVARGLALPDEVGRLTHGALLILLPWPAAIAYRRFRQGLLIRNHQTRRVAYGTVIRLVAMSATGLAAFRYTSMPGAHVGALALSIGVVLEAVAVRAMTHRLVPELLERPRAPERMAELSMPAITRFYTPLALTTLMALSIQPIVTFFMGQSRYPLESLAVLPVIDGLTFIFRAFGLSYLEVAIALLGSRREHFARLRNFAIVLAAGACGGLSAIVLTPLADTWFHTVSGLSLTLTAFALLPAQIMAPFPILSVTLHTQRAVLVHAHRTRPITTATAAEVLVVGFVLTVAIHQFDFVGAVAATTAILTGRIVSVAWLWPSCRSILQEDRAAALRE